MFIVSISSVHYENLRFNSAKLYIYNSEEKKIAIIKEKNVHEIIIVKKSSVVSDYNFLK